MIKRWYWKRKRLNEDRNSNKKYSRRPPKIDRAKSDSLKISITILNSSEVEMYVPEPTSNLSLSIPLSS